MHIAPGSRRLIPVLVLAATIAITAVVGVPSQAQAMAPNDLLSAAVPPMCGHPGGHLVNGSLPGIPEGMGQVTIGTRPTVARGKLRKHEKPSLAVVVTCDAGGVGWPQHILVYGPAGQLRKHIDLYNVTHGGRESVRRISIRHRKLVIQVIGIAAADDAACCGTRSALLKYRWKPARKTLVMTKKRIYSEVDAGRKLMHAINSGNRKLAARYLPADSLRFVWRDIRPGHRLVLKRCYGELSDRWYDDYMPGYGPRYCDVWALATRSGEQDEKFWAVRFTPTSWRAWTGTTFFGFD